MLSHCLYKIKINIESNCIHESLIVNNLMDIFEKLLFVYMILVFIRYK